MRIQQLPRLAHPKRHLLFIALAKPCSKNLLITKRFRMRGPRSSLLLAQPKPAPNYENLHKSPLRFSAQDGLITATQAESITTCEAWIQPYVKLYKNSGMISFNKSANTFGTTSTSHGNQRPRSSTGIPTADFKTLHPSGALACEGMRSGITGIPTTTNSDNILLTTSNNSDNILLTTSEEMPESFYAHLTQDLIPKPNLVPSGLNNKSCRKKQTNNKPNYKLGNNGFAASRGLSGNGWPETREPTPTTFVQQQDLADLRQFWRNIWPTELTPQQQHEAEASHILWQHQQEPALQPSIPIATFRAMDRKQARKAKGIDSWEGAEIQHLPD